MGMTAFRERQGETKVKRAGFLLNLCVMMFVAFLFTTNCGKKPKPEVEPTGVPEEQVEPGEETAPPETPATPEEPEERPDVEEISLRLKDIHFDYDDDSLRNDAKEALSQNAEVLKENLWVDVQIEGHCDERGTVEYNLALGERRALSAKRYLVSYGIDPSRISVISYGKERPIDPRHNEEAWAKNRRAHFVVK
jgi:peptidoglycan-associated lipoprotein